MTELLHQKNKKMTELHTNQIRQSVSIDYVLPQKPGFYTSTKISKAK